MRMLDAEQRYYAENLPSLLEQYRGRFVVIKERSVLGAFSNIDEALREGARVYGLQSFLARLVTEAPQVISIPALTLGLLHANPPHPIRGSGDESSGPDRSARS